MKAALALIPLALVVAASRRRGGSTSQPRRKCGEAWPTRRDVLRTYSEPLESASGWTGLADWLEIVAYQESCGSLTASHDGGIGRGPYALHSTTGAVQDLGGQSALYLLEDPAIAVATAATHAWRLTRGKSYNYPRDQTTWGDIRAGWAIPSWTGNRNAENMFGKNRDAVVQRQRERADQLGYPGLVDSLALPSAEWQWPGLRWALETLGRGDIPVED